MKNHSEDEGYTVAEMPPTTGRQRRSVWKSLFEECRGYPGQWRRTARSFSPGSAAQCASDIRNAHHREPGLMRMRGLLPGEVWEAVWGRDPNGSDPGRCFIWLRLVSSDKGAESDSSPVLRMVPSDTAIEYAW